MKKTCKATIVRRVVDKETDVVSYLEYPCTRRAVIGDYCKIHAKFN